MSKRENLGKRIGVRSYRRVDVRLENVRGTDGHGSDKTGWRRTSVKVLPAIQYSVRYI